METILPKRLSNRPMIQRTSQQSRKVQIVLLSLTLIAFGSTSHVDAADEGLDKYNVALGLYKQKRWKQAEDHFREFVKAFEKHELAPNAQFYLGMTLVEIENYQDARNEFETFIAKYPRNQKVSQARYRIAESSFLAGDYPAARKQFEDFLRDFPDSPFRDHALPFLGETFLQLNDAERALGIFDRAIEQFPTGTQTESCKFHRAKALELLKRYDDAIRQYQELSAQKDGSRVADARYYLGSLYFQTEQFADAVTTWTSLVKDYPTSHLGPSARLNSGSALFRLGRYADAADQFQLAASDSSQQASAKYWQGRSLKLLGDYSKALESLKSAATVAADQPILELILYEQGLCERFLQHFAESRGYFEQLMSRFPKGDLADDSMYALIEMSIEANDLSQSDQQLARFRKNYPKSGLWLSVEMLAGRIDLANAGQKQREKRPSEEISSLYHSAAQKFERVMKESIYPRPQNQARYYLALTRQLEGRHEQALELVGPLIEKALADPEKNDFSDGLILQADSYFQLKKYDQAIASIGTYVARFPKGRQTARALSIQALAAENLGKHEQAKAALNRLATEFSDHPIAQLALLQMAEEAEGRQDWAVARRLYESVYKTDKNPDTKAVALRGIAQSQFEQQDYLGAADTFERVALEFSKSDIALECRYRQAEALKRAEQPNRAIGIFRTIFQSTPTDKPIEPGAEQRQPVEFYYKAGLQVARIQSKMGDVDEADKSYEALVTRFPAAADIDKRLDEWAIMNYTKDRFDRSDTIWRRLVNDVPQSPLVNNARLSLAESDLFAKRFDQAKEAFEQLAESDKSSDETKERSLYQLLTLAVERQQWNDVRAIGQRLIAKFPQSPHRFYATYSEAESYLASQRPTEDELVTAREKLQTLRNDAANEAVANTEWIDRVWVLLAEINFREKKYADVLAVSEELRKRKPQSPLQYQAEEIVGRSYKQQARWDDARAAFKRVLSDPAAYRTETAAKAQFMIGETYFLQEKWKDAFEAYQHVYANYKFREWQAAALLCSGKCDEIQNEWKRAAETYRLVIKEFPGTTVVEEAKRRLEFAEKKPS